jgi:hypothetical protein
MFFTVSAILVLVTAPIIAYAYLLFLLPGQRYTAKGHHILNDLVLLGVKYVILIGAALLITIVLGSII